MHPGPLIVQKDHTVLLDTHAEDAAEARAFLARFADIHKTPEHLHTYKITPLSLWNAASAGLSPHDLGQGLHRYSRYPLPEGLLQELGDIVQRFGKIKLLPAEGLVAVGFAEESLRERIEESLAGTALLLKRGDDLFIRPEDRGAFKQALTKHGLPVDDQVGFADASKLPIALAPKVQLRPYQERAVQAFCEQGIGHGVVVLPCGAGKTLVGLGAMAKLGYETLILCASTSAAQQWRKEILEKTQLAPDKVGLFSAKEHNVAPVTISTYQKAAYRRDSGYPNFQKLLSRSWGLLIFDEVHLLPAPVFRLTAALQSRRRLGLTATLIREDGLEADVFALVGPKRFDLPWREAEHGGHIAKARCVEVRLPLSKRSRQDYDDPQTSRRMRFAIAAQNPRKIAKAAEILRRHEGRQTLIIGHFVAQLQTLAQRLDLPIITGRTPSDQRQKLYNAFRKGEIPTLVVSKVANFSIDLPQASVCIQVSGTFGSRQEEAQRLGRILRPKKDEAIFYTLVSQHTVESRYALNRQIFLGEQGYTYQVEQTKMPGKKSLPDNVIPFPTLVKHR